MSEANNITAQSAPGLLHDFSNHGLEECGELFGGLLKAGVCPTLDNGVAAAEDKKQHQFAMGDTAEVDKNSMICDFGQGKDATGKVYLGAVVDNHLCHFGLLANGLKQIFQGGFDGALQILTQKSEEVVFNVLIQLALVAVIFIKGSAVDFCAGADFGDGYALERGGFQ